MSHPAATHDFWQKRWSTGQTAFHEAAPNPHLLRDWPALGVAPGGRVLVPLCGKSLDLLWLAAAGYEVVGVELSDIACAAWFEAAGMTPERRKEGAFEVWHSGSVTLLQGDIFDLQAGDFDAAWDRAALIALPPSLRERYAAHIQARLKPGAPTLLVTIDYDAKRRDGPPFAVPKEAVFELYPGAVLLHDAVLDEARWAEIGGATEQVYRFDTAK